MTAAVEQQQRQGGRLGEILVGMGRITPEELEGALAAIPAAPLSLSDTGIILPDLLDLLLKTMMSGAVDSVGRVSDKLKLPPRLSEQLLGEAKKRLLVEVQGVGGGLGATPRYGLSAEGQVRARKAMERNGYVGPVPVPLADYAKRIRPPGIGGERVPPERVARALDGLIASNSLMAQIGPAINSGGTMLLYGPPGNGKTSVAERIGAIFAATIYVPYAFEIGGQIVKVYDPDIHRSVEEPAEEAARALAPSAPAVSTGAGCPASAPSS